MTARLSGLKKFLRQSRRLADMTEHVFDKYLRADKLRTMWCPGCGNGIVVQGIIRALDESGIDQNKVVIVSGIGCSSRAVNYLNTCGLHTTHGRAIPFATGVKMANPELTVVVISGDGDCTSIGGNHLIQGCRRNIDLTVVVVNNLNYGMTGGQYSPTTPLQSMTKTSVYGSVEPPFDVCHLAAGAGATYVARGMTYQPVQLKNVILKGIQHKGFSVIDAISDCPSLYGRLNKLGDAVAMMKRWPEIAVPLAKAKNMSEEELKNKVIYGEFVNNDNRREYTQIYDEVIRKAQGV
jgi:2-oxoglutarate ferredoxin oxidoreductase subunit beta